MMEVIGGMLEGFTKRTGELRDENQRRAEQDRALEEKLLLELANKSDDDEIRSMAVMGLLSGGQNQKKKGGLKGWFGEMQAHPAMEGIRGLLATPKRVETPAALPSQALTQGGVPDGAGVVPQPPGGLEEPIPGTAEDFAPPPPPADGRGGDPGGMQAPTVSYKPRQAFLSPADRISADTEAQFSGRLQGLVRGAKAQGVQFSQADIADMARGLSGAPRRAGTSKLVNVELHDGTVTVGRYDATTNDLVDENTDEPITNVKRILGTSSGAGMTTRVIPDPNSKTGWSAVRVDNAGTEHWRMPAQPPSQPFPYAGITSTPQGFFGVNRSGQGVQIPGQFPTAVDPQQYLSSVMQMGRQINDEANSAVRSLGSLGRDPVRVAAARDKVAANYGFPSWQKYQEVAGAALAGVQEGATPQAARPPTTPTVVQPPGAQPSGVDTNKVLEELRKRRGQAATAPPAAPR